MDKEIEKIIDIMCENFDLEKYFQKVKDNPKDIYLQAVALVITEDKLICRPDLTLHINAANEIYKRLYPDFSGFKERFVDKYIFWGQEGADIYHNVNACLSASAKSIPMYIPTVLTKFQVEQIKRVNDLANKNGIEVLTNIPNAGDDYSRLDDVMDVVESRIQEKNNKMMR